MDKLFLSFICCSIFIAIANGQNDFYRTNNIQTTFDSNTQRNRTDTNNNFYNTNNNFLDTNLSNNKRPLESDFSFNRGKSTYNVKSSFLDSVSAKQATYFIVASRMVRPGLIYQVAVSVFEALYPITVHASISRDGVEISGDSKDVKEGVPETLLMRVPPTSVKGNYKLRVEGLYNNVLGGIAFLNETDLTFSQRSMTIFIQTDKPVYMQGETVRFRAIPITTELRGFDNAIDVYMLDPNGLILKRWLSRQSNLGSVSLYYKLSDQPAFGEWKVRVIAQGQVEEHNFFVEEYYQTRFEVNVTMPAFFFTTDPYIYGKIMANFTSGAPVRGNLTIKASVRRLGWFRTKEINEKYRVGHNYNSYYRRTYKWYSTGGIDPFNPYMQYGPNGPINPVGPTGAYGQYGPNRQFTGGQFDNPYEQYDQFGQGQYNQYDQIGQSDVYGTDPNKINQDPYLNNPQYNPNNPYMTEKYFDFDEEWPFWIQKPEGQQTYDPWSGTLRATLPYLRFFNGTYEFKYPMRELLQLVPDANGMEIMITATVGEKYYDEIISGYSITRVYNSSIRLSFLGDSPQVFKPEMPHTCYLVVSYHDGSPLDPSAVRFGNLIVNGYVESQNGGRREYPQRELQLSDTEGVWELPIDLRNDLNLEEGRSGREYLTGIQKMSIQARFIDARGEHAEASVLLITHFSPRNQHIKISTSTKEPKVGEYIIFHIRSNFFAEHFNYLVMSKGIILLNGQEYIQEGTKTMAITLSSEMAPVATMVVWKMSQQGQVIADSLTFPVNGISRNNFTIYINNKKARTGEKVEVAIFGEPGAYVGLSGIDNAFYTMQAGNELSYAKIITKMSNFDEQTNGTYKYVWHFHEGTPDELVYFPASTFGIDANRTFEYAGLIVFTDGYIPRREQYCNITQGYKECLTGRCYRIEKECDGFIDCDDGTDEINCQYYNETQLQDFRKYRFNRIQRHYDNVWLWKDINIGPHGRYIFNVDVPDIPALWMVSAFGISPSKGFGMLSKAIEYVGVQPFYINIEMPTACMQGEQVGIRVTVFNYMVTPIEATVVLHASPDFKFVHVEEDGIVRSYNPRTSSGEHQFFIYIEAQESSIVYLPIVPTKLGDIDITIHAGTLLGTDEITRRIHVEADGLPQYRHQAILLDLSNRAYVLQYMHVNITETPIIPYQVERYFVYGSNKARLSIVGDVVGPIFPTMPVNATSLINLPADAGEQNMFSFAANLYTIIYMRLINQRNKTTEKNAFHYMNIGYQKQLSYLKPDGSFSLFRSDWNNSASSVWLTAYCARIFQEASFYEWENYIYIDPKVIEGNVRWLLHHQTPEGSFYEEGWSPDRKMNLTAHDFHEDTIKHRNISLTAHVLITLATVKDLAGGLGARAALAQQRAIHYIERNMRVLQESDEPYQIAIVAYAFILCRAPTAEQVVSILRRHERVIGDLKYWGKVELPPPPTKLENQKYFSLPRLPYEFDSRNIETTAYALLVLVSKREVFIDPIARWLNAQRLNDGGWASTQDTSVALKALIEYTVHSRIREVSSLSLIVEATSLPGETNILEIGKDNIAAYQSLEIPNAWGTVKVQAKGAGYAILQMHVQYNVDIEKYQTKPPVPAFGLYTRAEFTGRNQSHINYLSCSKWVNLNESIRSGLTVLDVTIPTGYFVQQQKLDSYVLSKRVRNLQRAKYSERKVLFYFEFLDEEDICVNFTVERWFPVANMSRYLPIRVYDFYAPERFNETIFDALPTYLLNICNVCGSSQCPYCSIYNSSVRISIISSVIIMCLILAFKVKNFFYLNIVI